MHNLLRDSRDFFRCLRQQQHNATAPRSSRAITQLAAIDPTSVDDTPSTLVTAAVIYYAKEMVYIHSECGVVALHGGWTGYGRSQFMPSSLMHENTWVYYET